MEKYICLLLLWGCANVVPPSGGPKDTSPPKVVYVEPGYRSTNFKGNKIVILFDEYIQIKNKLSIQMSPACDTGLKIEERGSRESKLEKSSRKLVEVMDRIVLKGTPLPTSRIKNLKTNKIHNLTLQKAKARIPVRTPASMKVS